MIGMLQEFGLLSFVRIRQKAGSGCAGMAHAKSCWVEGVGGCHRHNMHANAGQAATCRTDSARCRGAQSLLVCGGCAGGWVGGKQRKQSRQALDSSTLGRTMDMGDKHLLYASITAVSTASLLLSDLHPYSLHA
jgi:hypothetical protein